MLTLLYHAYLSVRHLLDVWTMPQQDRDERYLAESADIHDLERRLREVDLGRSGHYGVGATGIFTR